MSYIGKKPSFSQVRTAELAVQRGTDITTAGTIAALDVSNISLVRLTLATTLQGIAAPVSPVNNGKLLTIVNANSVSLTVVNESGSATAANRITTGISRDMVITAGASITLFYETASSRWVVRSSSTEFNIDRLKVATEAIALNSTDLTPGSSPKSGLVELTAGSQTSIRSISTGVNGQFLALVNKTGSLLQISNEDSGATAGNRILTGTGGPISLQSNASLFLAYLGSASRWQVVGGTGSGGGATEQVSQTGLGVLANFPVGTPLYVDATTGWTKAVATASNTAEVAGMLNRSLGNDLAEIVMAGEVAGVTSSVFVEGTLPARGEAIFLSTTLGKLTWTEPSVVGQVSKPLGIVHNVTAGVSVDIMFYNMRGAVVGGANARTTIGLSNNATTTVQNASTYDAGELAGWVYIDATTDYRFYIQGQFAKNGAGTNYNISYQTAGDTPPAGFSMSITAAGLIQVTLPSVAGFASAYINFALNAPAVGATLPLQISGGNVTGPVLGAGTGAAVAAGYIGETISSAVSAITVTNSTWKSVTSIALTPGVWSISTFVSVEAPTSGRTGSSGDKTFVGITTTLDSATGQIYGDSQGRVATFKNVFEAVCVSVSPKTYNVTSNTTYYVNVNCECNTAGGGVSPRAYGRISAVRIA